MSKNLINEIEKINKSLKEKLKDEYFQIKHLFITFEYNINKLVKIICKCGKIKCKESITFYQKYGLEF